MKRAALIFGLFFSLALSAAGQVRTVTNSTLEKFQQKRIAAERDYRANYERLGFPSPEELDRQREADLKAKIELSEQLRQTRLEKERLELERRNLDLEAATLQIEYVEEGYPVSVGGAYGSYGGYYYDGRYRRRGGGRLFNRGGYRVDPFGVYPTQPIRTIRLPRSHRGGSVFRTRRR
jgi:hypothetical protein